MKPDPMTLAGEQPPWWRPISRFAWKQRLQGIQLMFAAFDAPYLILLRHTRDLTMLLNDIGRGDNALLMDPTTQQNWWEGWRSSTGLKKLDRVFGSRNNN